MKSFNPPRPINGGTFKLDHAMWGLGPWIAEPKWDGWRCLISPEGAFSRHDKPMPEAEEFVQAALAVLFTTGAEWIDGELLGMRDSGERAYVIYDIKMPGTWAERRRFLEERLLVCGEERPERGTYLTPYSLFCAEMFGTCKRAKAEGIVVKKMSSKYGAGDFASWVKFRFNEQPE